MMKGLIVAGLLTVLFGCSDGPELSTSQNDIDRAALSALWPLPDASTLFPESESTLDHHQKWVDEKRAWALTLDDVRYRKAYLRWVNHVEWKIKENREENRTHARANAFKKYEEKRRGEREREELVAPHLPKPPR